MAYRASVMEMEAKMKAHIVARPPSGEYEWKLSDFQVYII
jgi:hypothetical protein